MTHNFKFKVGDRVKKIKGYNFPSVVVSNFKNTKGEKRIVCECVSKETSGILHIFNEDQMEIEVIYEKDK